MSDPSFTAPQKDRLRAIAAGIVSEVWPLGKVTVIVRHLADPDKSIVLTDDDLNEVKQLIERRQATS